jgi:hypothetical protein
LPSIDLSVASGAFALSDAAMQKVHKLGGEFQFSLERAFGGSTQGSAE